VHDQSAVDIDHLFYNMNIAAFYLGFCVALHFTKQWYLQREQLRKVELEKLSTELDYLKSQINPHFLFNSINTIFFQIDKQNAEARETLSRFSEMLRYQLYECNGAAIPIEKEIAYLSNYVELQRIRKDENYEINFTTSNVANFSLPPLLLIPLVENAFKHVSHFSNGKNKIDISLEKENDSFRLNVFNTRDNSSIEHNGGIGLKNVKRRLELLYKDSHTLSIVKSPEGFEVMLELDTTTYYFNHIDKSL
jgi:LytS/YehU family sensor histidine kinase